MHELILTFDWCRADIDYNDCDQIACTEIRGTRLSGECSPKGYINQLNSNVLNDKGRYLTSIKYGKPSSGKGLRCIRKQSAFNVDKYIHCHTKNGTGKRAWESVNNVWLTCFNDLDPIYDKLDSW